VQFHWTNRTDEPYADFAGFLASLQRDKRKKIQQEQRRVADAGIAFSAATGDAIDAADWDFFYRCYTLTYRATTRRRT
jgi:predicted N-acyltransferase